MRVQLHLVMQGQTFSVRNLYQLHVNAVTDTFNCKRDSAEDSFRA